MATGFGQPSTTGFGTTAHPQGMFAGAPVTYVGLGTAQPRGGGHYGRGGAGRGSQLGNTSANIQRGGGRGRGGGPSMAPPVQHQQQRGRMMAAPAGGRGGLHQAQGRGGQRGQQASFSQQQHTGMKQGKQQNQGKQQQQRAQTQRQPPAMIQRRSLPPTDSSMTDVESRSGYQNQQKQGQRQSQAQQSRASSQQQQQFSQTFPQPQSAASQSGFFGQNLNSSQNKFGGNVPKSLQPSFHQTQPVQKANSLTRLTPPLNASSTSLSRQNLSLSRQSSQQAAPKPKPNLTQQHKPQQPSAPKQQSLARQQLGNKKTQAKIGPDVEEEEEYKGDEYYGEEEEGELDQYYDEEYYDEEEDGGGQEEQGESEKDEPVTKDSIKTTPSQEAAKQVRITPSGIALTNEVITLLNTIRLNSAEFKDLCMHFVTDSCTFNETCKRKHDQGQKDKLIIALKAQGYGSETPAKETAKKPAVSAQKPVSTKATVDKFPEQKQQQSVAKQPGPDLRNLMNRQKVEEEMKKPQEILDSSQMPGRVEASQMPNRVEPNQMPPPTSTNKQLGSRKPIAKQASPSTPSFTSDKMMPARQTHKLAKQPSMPKLFRNTSERTSQTIEQSRNRIIQDIEYMKTNPQLFIIPGKAQCLQMCSDRDIHQRSVIEVSSISPFEKDQRGQMFNQLAIKTYNRSAADKVMNQPDEIRPPAVLYKVVEYLRECIGDLDRVEGTLPFNIPAASFLDVYSFFRDRAKCITQDFGIINLPDNEYLIKSLEELTRFMICVLHDGMCCQNFVMKQHIQIINANLTALTESYDAVRQNYPNLSDPYRLKCLENEPEFKSYQILNFSNNPVTSAELISGLNIQDFQNEEGQKLLRYAISLNLAVQTSLNFTVQTCNFPKYFGELKRTNNYLFACMMLIFLNPMRKHYLEALVKVEVPKEGTDLEYIQKCLLFDSEEDTEHFVRACGFTQIDNNRVRKTDRLSAEQQNEKFQKYFQTERLSFMDDLRGTKSRCEITKTPLLILPPIQRHTGPLIQSAKKPIPLIQASKPSVSPAAPVSNAHAALSNEEEIKKKALEAVRKQKEQEERKIAQAQKEEEEKRQKELQKLKEMAVEKERLVKEKLLQEQRLKEEKERIEKEKKDQEAKEKKLMEDLKRKKQEVMAKKFINFINKVKAFYVRNMTRQNLEFFRAYKPLLGKKRLVRSFQTNEQDQFEEEYLEEALEKIPEKELSRQISETYENIIAKKFSVGKEQEEKPYDISYKASQLLQDQDGVLKVKLFYHSANKEGSSSEVLKTLIHEIFASDKKDKQGSVQYRFKAIEFPQSEKEDKALISNSLERASILMEHVMGTNLLVFFSSMKSIQGDIQKVQDLFKLCPDYSRFTVLWIVSKQSEEFIKTKNIGEQTILEAFQNELRTEKISHLKVSTIYSCNSNSIQKSMGKLKKQPFQQRSGFSIKNAVLAFIIKELEEAISKSKIYPIAKQDIKIKVKLLVKAVETSLGGLYQLIQSSQEQLLQKELRGLAKFLQSSTIQPKVFESEVQIFNFLYGAFQQFLNPLLIKMKNFIQQIVQQFKYNKYNIEQANQIKAELQLFTKILSIQPYTWLQDPNGKESGKHLSSQIARRLDQIYPKATVKKIQLFAENLHKSCLTPSSDPQHQVLCKGVMLFQAFISPFLSLINPKSYFFENNEGSHEIRNTLADVDLKCIEETLKNAQKLSKEEQELSGKMLTKKSERLGAELQLSQATKVKACKVQKSADLFAEEIKSHLDSNTFENQRMQILAKLSMDIAMTLNNLNEAEVERQQKLIEEINASCSMPQKRQKITEKIGKEPIPKQEDFRQDLKEKEEFLAKLNRPRRFRTGLRSDAF